MAKSKKYVLECFKNAAGNISLACEKAGISRMTFNRWYKANKKFKQDVDDVRESLIDLAESMLLKNIKDGKTAEIIFFLKTKGRERGYIERIETVNKEVSKFDELTDEELDAEIEKQENKCRPNEKKK